LKEEDIRPQEIFDEYLKLAEIDTETYFSNASRYVIKCPACDSDGEHAFSKNGFAYSNCSNCNTLYVSPRPESSAFKLYYLESPSVKYWATTFYKVTENARREKLWKPKAKIVNDIIKRYLVDANVIDIGGGFGVFAEEMERQFGRTVTVVEPSPCLAESCRDRGLTVIEDFLEGVDIKELPDGVKAFVSFELFEHLHNPMIFLKQISSLMQRGDIFIFTTLSGTGVDIQGLWDDSKSVSPPHHLNFFNPYSVEILLSKVGMNCLEVTTPGKLDVDILSNNHNLIKDRFLKTFITYATDEEKGRWQEMISQTGWSSHMMVCCQKP